MKKITLILLVLALAAVTKGQEVPTEPKFKFQGGLWSGTNGKTSLVGVPAAKLSVMFQVSEKAKLETGLMLIPGLILDEAGGRFGLSAGASVTLRKDVWKLKPVLGLVFVKTDTWQAIPGVGFVIF